MLTGSVQNTALDICPHATWRACEENGSMMTNFLKNMEIISSRNRKLSRLYGVLFYRKMIRKEIEKACLEPGRRVLNIGCGPLPLTALELAESGMIVDAVDVDNASARMAKNYLSGFESGCAVNVINADGINLTQKQYDAIWVSLSVFPKKEVLTNSLELLRAGGRLIYRNQRGWLALISSGVAPEQIIQKGSYSKMRQILGKETIVMQKSA